MTVSMDFAPRALPVAAPIGLVAGAASLVAPRALPVSSAPVGNTTLMPEQHAAFRQALAASDAPAVQAAHKERGSNFP